MSLGDFKNVQLKVCDV